MEKKFMFKIAYFDDNKVSIYSVQTHLEIAKSKNDDIDYQFKDFEDYMDLIDLINSNSFKFSIFGFGFLCLIFHA